MNHLELAREWARLLDELFRTRGETLDAAVAASAGALAAGSCGKTVGDRW